MQIGWVTAIWMPAMRLASTGRAARPSTNPATPAEAKRPAPYSFTLSKVSSTTARVMMATKMTAARCSTRIWVRNLRAVRLSSTSMRKRRARRSPSRLMEAMAV